MTYHFGSNEYYHLVGRVLMNEVGVSRIIQGLQEEHDSVYRFTDGISGNAYRIYVMVAGTDEMESLHFRHFREVIKKYGVLQPEKPRSLLTIRANQQLKNANSSYASLHGTVDESTKQPESKIKKCAKIYPED